MNETAHDPRPHQEGCTFCRIVEGTARSARVLEDERTLVFMDLFPVAEGHTLIIPKPHWENIFETPAEALAEVVATSKRVADAIMRSLAPDGIAVFQLNGSAAGQTVFHYHMHLVPRMHGSSLQIHGRQRADREALARIAGRIAAGLDKGL